MRKPFLLIILISILLVSCNNGSHCYESADTFMVTSFTGAGTHKIGPMMVKGYGKNAAGDTLYYNADSALVKRVALPLSLNADSTGFIVVTNGKSNAFWVRHSMQIKLISQSCGFAPYYALNATKHSQLIDSIRVYNADVDPKSTDTYATNGQNISIYFNITAL